MYYIGISLCILACICLTLYVPCLFFCGRYIFGWLPAIRSCTLSREDIQNIKTYGISHCTTDKGYKAILKDGRIKASKWDKAYSNHYKPCVFFCINNGPGAEEGFNRNNKYTKKIIITNLTDAHIANMTTRECDKSIHYQGDFSLTKDLQIQTVDLNIQKHRTPIKEVLLTFFDIRKSYTRSFWYAVGIELIILFIICVILMSGLLLMKK